MPPGVAGVDEAGRGPLAGPVYAAAVILDPQRPLQGLRDSKQLSEAAREQLAGQIRASALAWSVAWADSEEIDALNILQATFLAMRRAVLGLGYRPQQVLVDGNRLPPLLGLCDSARAVVRGDATAGHQRGLYSGQVRTRSVAARLGPDLSGIWTGAAQGLPYGCPSGGAA